MANGQDPNITAQHEVMRQIVQAMQQQQALAGARPTQPVEGLLAPGQQDVTDVLKAPSEAQLSAIVTGLLSAADPNSRAPLISGVAGGLSALQAQRQRDLEAKQAFFDSQTKALQQRIDNLSTIGGLAGDIRSEERLDRKLQLDVSKEERVRAEADAETWIDPNTGETFQLQRDRFGNALYQGKPVNPTDVGLVPFSDQQFKLAQEKKQALSDQADIAMEMRSLVFDPKFAAVVGPLEARGALAEQLGLGGEIEIMRKKARQVTGQKVLADLEKMGVRPSDRDLQFAKSLNLNVRNDPEVWQDQYLNKIIPHYYKRLSETFGEEVARERVAPLVRGLDKSQFAKGVEVPFGSITDQLMNPPPKMPTGGGPVISPDGKSAITSGGERVIIRRRGDGQQVPVSEEGITLPPGGTPLFRE